MLGLPGRLACTRGHIVLLCFARGRPNCNENELNFNSNLLAKIKKMT